MARTSGLSVSTVQRIWPAFGLQPHREGTFNLSTNPDFVDKVRDIVGLYGDCQDFRVWRAVEHYAAMALMKRSPKMTANWALAMDHSRGGIFHSFSDRFKIR